MRMSVTRFAISSILLIAATTAALAAPSVAPAPEPAASSPAIWAGISNGANIRWTIHDFTIEEQATGAPTFSMAQVLRKKFDAEDAARRADDARIATAAQKRGDAIAAPNPCTREMRLALLSVVGSVVSLKQTDETYCKDEAHPSEETRFVAFTVKRDGKSEGAGAPARLSDFFSAAQLFQALKREPLVRKALAAVGGTRPATLPDLLATLAEAPPVFDQGACYAFPDDLLARFAFHHIEHGQVAVRLSLAGAGPCRGRLTQIGILLPLPQSLASALTKAQSRSQGFLMQDAETIAAGRATTLHFGSSP